MESTTSKPVVQEELAEPGPKSRASGETTRRAKKSDLPKMRAGYTPHDPADYATVNNQPSMTEEAHGDRVNINTIMDKYLRTGIIDHVNHHQPNYGIMDGSTYHEQMCAITNANEMFMELPAKVREKFGHDPAKFLDYVDGLGEGAVSREKAAELIELGMIHPSSKTAQIALQAASGDVSEPTSVPPPESVPADSGSNPSE